MAPGGADAIRKKSKIRMRQAWKGLASLDEGELLEDVQLTNLEGGKDGSSAMLLTMAEKWGTELGYDGGRLGGKIRTMKAFLPKGLAVLVDRALRDSRNSKIPPALAQNGNDDDDSSSDDDDSHGDIAAFCFGIPGEKNDPPSSQRSKSTKNATHREDESVELQRKSATFNTQHESGQNTDTEFPQQELQTLRSDDASDCKIKFFSQHETDFNSSSALEAAALPRSPVLTAVDNVLEDRSPSLSRTASIVDNAVEKALSEDVTGKTSIWSKLASLKAQPSLVLRLADQTEGQRHSDKNTKGSSGHPGFRALVWINFKTREETSKIIEESPLHEACCRF